MKDKFYQKIGNTTQMVNKPAAKKKEEIWKGNILIHTNLSHLRTISPYLNQ